MQASFEPICEYCEYYQPGIDDDNPRNEPVCRAFPEGIPSEILNGGVDHREKLGDEPVTFKLASDATQEDVDDWERRKVESQKGGMQSVLQDFEPTET